MRIGIDIDEVIADTLTAMIEFHNSVYETDLRRTDFGSYRFWETWGGTHEEAIQKVFDFFATDHFASISPVAGSLSALTILKERGHNLFAITGRHSELVEKTEQWVFHYFPEVFSEIHFVNTFSLTQPVRKKSAVCKQLGVTLMIEDDIDHARDCAAQGIDTILLDYPWNQGEVPTNVYRVSSWDDVIRLVS